MILSSNDRDNIFFLYSRPHKKSSRIIVNESTLKTTNQPKRKRKTTTLEDGTIVDDIGNPVRNTLTNEEWKRFERKILIAKNNLMKKLPFVSYILTKLHVVPTTDIPTMAVDNFLNIYINPFFVINNLKIEVDRGNITTDDVAGVLFHETLHIMNETMSRKTHRNHKIWNFSTDYIMNRDIIKSGFTLPSLGLVPLTLGDNVYALPLSLFGTKIAKKANELRTIEPGIIGEDITNKVYNITDLTAEELYKLYEKELKENPELDENEKQEPDVEINVGDIVKDTTTGTYGKVLSIDQNTGIVDIDVINPEDLQSALE